MPDLTAAQADRLAAMEAAPDAPESLRGRVARAIHLEGGWCGGCDFDGYDLCAECRATTRTYADAALRVITEDARS